MGQEEKSILGFKETKTKWDYFKDNNRPVSVIHNGTKNCGQVSEINKAQDYVKLQPAVFPNAYGTEVHVKDKPVFVPFNSIPCSISEQSLEEFAQSWNSSKLQERIFKGETRIIIPKQGKF